MAEKTIPNPVKFAIGGMAGMGGTMVVQPLDLVKNRLQISAKGEFNSAFHCIQTIVAKEGFTKLYAGLGAGLLRQATYTTTRFGIYNTLLDNHKAKNNGQMPNVWYKLAFGFTAGGCGSVVGTPAEVCLIRMTSDGRLPVEQRRGYTSVGNALARIVREEGVLTLWRGCAPTVARAMVLNMAQLASYSQFKEMFKNTGKFDEGIPLHFVASMCSGFVSTVVSMPVDIVKTRIQNMKFIDGKGEYRGAGHCFTSLVKNEGVLALWKGFLPYYFRLGPHTVLAFVFMEQLNQAYKARM